MSRFDKKDIGKKIKELRLDRKYSLRFVGEKLGIDYSYLSKIEKGTMPSLELLEKIAEFFNKDLSYFFVNDEQLQYFNSQEKELMFAKELSIEYLKNNFELVVDDRPATDEEIEEMIKAVRFLRYKSTSKE